MRMKLAPLVGFCLLIGVVVGWGVSNWTATDVGEGTGEKELLYWQAPMDPSYRSDKPGKSPMGMDLVPVYEGEEPKTAADEAVVRISPGVINQIGIRTAKVTRSDLSREIETVGYIALDEDKTSHIHVRADGWIENLVVKTVGERVQKGDLLFQIYSPTLVNAQAEYLQAIGSGQKGLIAASRTRLRALDVTEAQIEDLLERGSVNNLVDVRASQDGIITELNVGEGMYIQPGTTIASLADLSTVWVVADIFEDQAEWVEEGLTAIVRMPFVLGQFWEGTVEYVYPVLDPVSRTIKVRLSLDNPREQLKPNMYAEVTIRGVPNRDSLSIPREALIRTGTSEHVIVALGDGRFRPVDVVSGMEAGDRVEILFGLSEGDEIVVSGQFLIDSEASLTAGFRRMGQDSGSPEFDSPISATSLDAGAVAVRAEGRITAVLFDEGELRIAHGAISSLGWPAMTMDFSTSVDIDLTEIKRGDNVLFTISKGDGDKYVVTSLSIIKK